MSFFSLDTWPSRLGVLCLVFASVLLIWVVVFQQVRDEQELRLRGQAVLIEEALKDKIGQYESTLRHLQNYLQKIEEKERLTYFKNYLQTLDLGSRYPGTQGVGFARFESRPDGGFAAIISAIEPASDELNRRVLGYDMAGEVTRRAAFLNALKSNLPTMSAPIILRQDLEGEHLDRGPGFLIVLPLFDTAASATPLGFIYAALRSREFFEGIWSSPGVLTSLGVRGLDIRSTGPSGEVVLYQRGKGLSRDNFYSVDVDHGLSNWKIRFAPDWPMALRLYYKYGPHLLGLVLLVVSSLIVFSLNRVALQFRFEESSLRRLFHSEQKVRETSEFLLRVNRITKLILSEIEYSDLMRKIALLLSEECSCENITVISRPLGALEPTANIDITSEGLYSLARLDASKLFAPEIDAVFGRSSIVTSETAEGMQLAKYLFGDTIGDSSWLLVRLLSRNGQIIGYIAVVGYPKLDPSQEMALLLRHLTSQLSSALENASLYKQAKAASGAKTSFMANMSHEIRTPLNAIIGFSEMMSYETLSETQRSVMLRTVRQSGAQLTRLIDDILDISKVEAGQLSIDKDWVPVSRLLTDIREVLNPRAEEKQIKLIVESGADVPAAIFSDEIRLKQILLNLLGNSIKFTDDGFVRLRVATRGEALVFEVEDTGVGIPPDFRERIFEPFSQGDASTTRTYGGSGLGLALARRLAALLDGQLSLVDSKVGMGTKFEVVLDPVEMRQTDETPTLSVIQSNNLEEDRSLAGKEILLVEDSIDNQEIFAFFLEKAGAKVEVVDNGRAAVDRALQRRYDMILMDIQIPVLDGKGATRILRESNYTGPIVALTAHALTEQRREVLKAGCDGHISKPVSGQSLISQIQKFMGPEARQ